MYIQYNNVYFIVYFHNSLIPSSILKILRSQGCKIHKWIWALSFKWAAATITRWLKFWKWRHQLQAQSRLYISSSKYIQDHSKITCKGAWATRNYCEHFVAPLISQENFIPECNRKKFFARVVISAFSQYKIPFWLAQNNFCSFQKLTSNNKGKNKKKKKKNPSVCVSAFCITFLILIHSRVFPTFPHLLLHFPFSYRYFFASFSQISWQKFVIGKS